MHVVVLKPLRTFGDMQVGEDSIARLGQAAQSPVGHTGIRSACVGELNVSLAGKYNVRISATPVDEPPDRKDIETMQKMNVPYFSQWETPEMTLPVIAEGSSALMQDPLWQHSGAKTIEEYARWAVNVCGMACLKMILAARGEIHPTLVLARACTAYGGYVVDEVDSSIKGLIYAPFVKFVAERHGLAAETMTNVETATIPELLSKRRFFIASVNSGIRWPEREPSSKGGHLVLVTDASTETIRFHNPSGHERQSQADVTLPLAVFDHFFANRGIAVGF